MKPLHSIVLFVATCLALLFGASNPCLLLSCFMILLVVVLALGVTIIYVEDLRKTLVVPLGLRQPEEATFLQYCETHHSFYSCFFEGKDAWAGRPQRLLLYVTSLWIMFMWALYSDSKFAFLASEFGSQVAKCQYWVTILGILAIPRVVVCFMESMLMLTRRCDDATLVDQVEEKVDILASGATAVQREAAAENLSYCLLALKNGLIVSFCVAVYVVTLLGVASAASHTGFFVWFLFIFQCALALIFDTVQTYVAYWFSIEYGEIAYLKPPQSNMDRYYTDDGELGDLDAQNAIHEELGL